MISAIIILVLILIGSALFWQNKKKDPEKIFGVYKFRKFKTSAYQYWGMCEDSGLGETSLVNVEELEKLQELSPHPQAFDAVFFQGANFDGYYFCGGIERRHNAKANGLFYIVVPDVGLLCSERLPDTLLNVDVSSILIPASYSAEGICFTPVKPMKTWKILYKGKMRFQTNPSQLVNVNMEAEWTTHFPHFHFDVDMDNRPIARAVARELWTEDYFKALKTAHQTHYEQMGFLKGTLKIDDKKYKLDMLSFRDHSFGYKRDWRLMHRYAFHMIFLQDGRRISVGVVSQPCTTSHLEMGYIVNKDKSINPIESCDLLLYQHGENGKPGEDIAFSFVADNTIYDVKATVEYQSEHYKGNNIEARLIERFLKYQVNGVEGRGISEWHYCNFKV